MIISIFILSLLLVGTSCDETKKKSYEELYAIGKNSYLANDWRNCIKFIKASIESYHNYKNIVKSCRDKCDSIEPERREPLDSLKTISMNNYEENMIFYEALINSTLCMMKCKRLKLGSFENPHPDPDIVKHFEERLTYDYLQSCYHKVDEIKNAADAAFTNLVHNHQSEVMRDNLNYYLENDSRIKYEDLVNLEGLKYAKLFKEGVEAYEKKDFDSVIRYFELAIIEYIDAWKTCRLNCDKPFDMGWFPDFMTSTANHFTYCLRCKQSCLSTLANLDGEYYHDIFPQMYHYLQFAYYKKNDIRKSTEALESYLTLYDSKEMSQNKEYFQDLPQIQKDGEDGWFIPRPEVKEYFAVIKRENDVIKSIENNFKFDNDNEEKKGPEPPTSLGSEKTEL